MKGFGGFCVIITLFAIDPSSAQIEIVIPGFPSFPTFPTFPRPIQKDSSTSFTSTSNRYPPTGFSTQTQYFGNTAHRLGGGVQSFTSSYPSSNGVAGFNSNNYNGGGIRTYTSSYPSNAGRSFGIDESSGTFLNSNGYGYRGRSDANNVGFANTDNGRRYDDVDTSFNRPQNDGVISFSHNVQPLYNKY